LLKPGPLTPEEWEIMKTHTTIGANILAKSSSKMLQLAEQIALTHHERWDGTGYPNGLSGTEIPLAGRITSICDVFDALTSERPYKKAWSVSDALAEIERGKGSQFDPELVDHFLSILPQIFVVKVGV
jgi:putative two-component system response regulator